MSRPSDAVRTDAPVVTTPAGDPPAGLLEAFWTYERALADDDVPALDALFAPGDSTVRGDAAGLLVGHDAVGRFRVARGGAPQRRIAEVHVHVTSPDAAVVLAVTVRGRGGHGLQTQLWRRADAAADGPGAGWQIAAAQVAAPPTTLDPAVWTVVGTPLVAGAGDGPLRGTTVAVKDLFAVAGHPVGGGVPAFRAGAPVETAHAAAVSALLGAGADVAGIARTDQFAYSIMGVNPHYGTPVNPAVPGGLPGGSTSGTATAVALGDADLGLGTDTAGSIRVPASYQGLWGLRTTHGSVDATGLLPLAPDFDAVGLLAREPRLLARAAAVLCGTGAGAAGPLLVAPQLLTKLDPAVAQAFSVALSTLGEVREIGVPVPEALHEAFRVHQAWQAWQVHGAWIDAHPDAVVGDVRARFAAGAAVSEDDDAAAVGHLAVLGHELDDALADGVLLLPSTPSPAPRVWDSPARLDAVRGATLRMTCVAGVTGRPAVSVPVLSVPGTGPGRDPVGLCLVGPRGSDVALVERAAELAVLLSA